MFESMSFTVTPDGELTLWLAPRDTGGGTERAERAGALTLCLAIQNAGDGDGVPRDAPARRALVLWAEYSGHEGPGAVTPREAPDNRVAIALPVGHGEGAVGRCRVDISGIPCAWYDLDPPRLTLAPPRRDKLSLTIPIPAGAITAAADLPVGVRVVSPDGATVYVSMRGVLTTDGGDGGRLALRPIEVVGRYGTIDATFAPGAVPPTASAVPALWRPRPALPAVQGARAPAIGGVLPVLARVRGALAPRDASVTRQAPPHPPFVSLRRDALRRLQRLPAWALVIPLLLLLIPLIVVGDLPAGTTTIPLWLIILPLALLLFLLIFVGGRALAARTAIPVWIFVLPLAFLLLLLILNGTVPLLTTGSTAAPIIASPTAAPIIPPPAVAPVIASPTAAPAAVPSSTAPAIPPPAVAVITPAAVPSLHLPGVVLRPTAAPATALSSARSSAAARPPDVLLNPATLDFGGHTVATTSAARTINVVNLSPTTLTAVTHFTITGVDARDFTVRSTCIGGRIDAYHSCAIVITFTPRARGTRLADLVIADDASAGGTRTVPLNGRGF